MKNTLEILFMRYDGIITSGKLSTKIANKNNYGINSDTTVAYTITSGTLYATHETYLAVVSKTKRLTKLWLIDEKYCSDKHQINSRHNTP